MRYLKPLLAAVLAAILFAHGLPAAAQPQLIESYNARLGKADHYNSKGVRLRHVWQIIRQDRANYHRFGIRDPEDQSDGFFGSIKNRAALERMLLGNELDNLVLRGTKYREPGFEAQILNGTPLVSVRVYQDGAQTFVVLNIL